MATTQESVDTSTDLLKLSLGWPVAPALDSNGWWPGAQVSNTISLGAGPGVFASLEDCTFCTVFVWCCLWAYQNDTTIHPVNQKGWGQRSFLISVAAQGFDSSSNKHEENMDHRCKEPKYVLGKKL